MPVCWQVRVADARALNEEYVRRFEPLGPLLNRASVVVVHRSSVTVDALAAASLLEGGWGGTTTCWSPLVEGAGAQLLGAALGGALVGGLAVWWLGARRRSG